MRRFWNVFKRLCAKYPAIFYFFYGRRSEVLPPAARNLLIDGTWFRLHQLKYFFRDRVWKRPYKVIDWRGEFGAEIKWAVPFAYWHHLNGTLKKTISSKDTKHFYYFSQDHTEIDRQRKYLTTPEVPNSEDHNFEYDFSKWERVPFREKYANQLGITFEKPLLIISNKYNTEWSKGPVNFLDLDALIQICRMVDPDYQICYNRPGSSLISEDNSSILDLDEKAPLKLQFPDLILAEDLYHQHKSRFHTFNHFQLALYANCKHFISVQGGNSVLCSYFGGTNIVYAKQGAELLFNECENFYGTLAGAKVVVSQEVPRLIELIQDNLLD